MSDNALLLFHISRVLFALANIGLMYSFLTPKRPLWFQITAFAGTIGLHLFLRTLLAPLGFDPFFIGYALAVLYLLPVALIFQETIHIKIFVVFMIVSFSQFNFLCCLFLEQILFGHITSKLLLTGQLLEFCAIPLIKKYIIPYIKDILEMISPKNYIFILFPFFSYLLLAFYGVQRNYILSLFIPMLSSTIIIFFAYYLISLSIKRTTRQQELEKQMAIQRDYYLNLNDRIAEIKLFRHDLRHHLVTISGFLDKKDAPAAQSYLNQLHRIYDDSPLPSVCNNQSADALICHYSKLAKQQGITFTTELTIPEHLDILPLDLCVIIGNCLENAIEACKKENDDNARFLNMKAFIAKGYLVMKFANSFAGSIQYHNDLPVSSKGSSEHGLGLSSVKSLAAKYQGHCSITCDNFVFTLSVSLKCTKAGDIGSQYGARQKQLGEC